MPAPDKFTLPSNDKRFTIRWDEGDYASYWLCDADLDSVIEVSMEISVDRDAATILYTRETQENIEYPFTEALDVLNEETPLFFRVYNDDFSLSWENQETDQVVVGLISDDLRYMELIGELYRETTGSDLSDHEFEEVYDFLTDKV